MRSPAPPEASPMAGLVKADPTLAALPGALGGAARRGWTLHDVQWVPGRHCRLAWRVPGAVGAASSYQAGLVDAGGYSSYDYRSDPLLPSLGAASRSTSRSGRAERGRLPRRRRPARPERPPCPR